MRTNSDIICISSSIVELLKTFGLDVKIIFTEHISGFRECRILTKSSVSEIHGTKDEIYAFLVGFKMAMKGCVDSEVIRL